MENKKILLPNVKYIGAPDKDNQLRINLQSKDKGSIEGLYNYTINSNEQFSLERRGSNLFRTYLRVSGMYYSNGINNPFINNYYKEFNTNYYFNKQEINNPNDNRNFTVGIFTNTAFVGLSTNQVIPFNTIVKDSNPSGYDILNYRYTAQELTRYIFGSTTRINLKNISASAEDFVVKINFIKNDATTPETVFSQVIFNGNIGPLSTLPTSNNLITSGITLNVGDTIKMEIEESSSNGSNLEYSVITVSGLRTFINSFYGNAQGLSSFDSYLSNIDFLYDPIKVVGNTNVVDNDPEVTQYTAKSLIFSITAPYDDIIINNISPLTTIGSERLVELIDYWYLPTDIKRDGSYNIGNYVNSPGDPVIVSASTGWINIGTFLSGTTEANFTQSNVLRTNLSTFRGSMLVKIPKYKTYSFFVTIKNGDDMTSNEFLKTSYGYDSVAGFMGLPDTMALGDSLNIKAYQQYCWLNIWPDSYQLSATTVSGNGLLTPNVSYRDYYGWSNNFISSPSSSNPYIFTPNTIISAYTNTYAFKGIVNYKIVQKEPYQYRTQKLISYDDYFDSVVLSKQNLEYVNENTVNWDLYSMYSYDRENNINLYIVESGLTNTFKISDGIPAKYNSTLTSFEISASTTNVFNSYFDHNLSVGDYISVKTVSGTTVSNIGIFPIVSIGSNNNANESKLFTVKISGFTGQYIQFKRFTNPRDIGSLSQYYIRKYKVIENSDNYTLTTPLSRNGFGNSNYFLTNKNEVDLSNLSDENGNPITEISFFFKKKNILSTTNHIISRKKNTFYDKFYEGRNGFISNEVLVNSVNFFTSGTSLHNIPEYGLGLMVSGLTNTYRNGSVTNNDVFLGDDVSVFECEDNLNIGDHIEFSDFEVSFLGLSSLTESIIYRKGDDFNYNKDRLFSLFSQYTKKPIGSNYSNNIISLMGVKPILLNVFGSKIAGSNLLPNYSIVYIDNNLSNFPIGSSILFRTGSTGSLISANIVNYEQGGLYATIDNSTFSNTPIDSAVPLETLQYYGNDYRVKKSNLLFEHFAVYYLGSDETKISISDSINIGDNIFGDIVEYNERELNTYVLQTPNYLFKLKDIYGYTGLTSFSGITSTNTKTDLLYPIKLKYFTNTIYRSSNIEDKESWAVFNGVNNFWEWRELIPNGEIDDSDNGTNFPFLNGRHYVYNDIILPFRSKYWNPTNGNIRSLNYNPNFNFGAGLGTLQSIIDIDIC
jgi:hypothetical protein